MTRPASPFAAPPLRKVRSVKRDTSLERDEKAAVWARDLACVVRKIRPDLLCDGPMEIDHIRASGALSKKSVTHRSNMVVLCHWHHRLKTEYGRTWRPLLLAYLERVGER